MIGDRPVHIEIDGGLDPPTAPLVMAAGADVLVARLRVARGMPDAEQTALTAAFMQRCEHAVTLTEMYTGVPQALDALRAKGHHLGLCTNKPMAPTMALLRRLDLQ